MSESKPSSLSILLCVIKATFYWLLQECYRYRYIRTFTDRRFQYERHYCCISFSQKVCRSVIEIVLYHLFFSENPFYLLLSSNIINAVCQLHLWYFRQNVLLMDEVYTVCDDWGEGSGLQVWVTDCNEADPGENNNNQRALI